MPTCHKCGVTRREEEFRLRKSVATGLHYRGKVCQPCHNAKSVAWRHANPDRVREYNAKQRKKDPAKASEYALRGHYRRRFGITLEDRARLLEEQGGACRICKRTTPTRRGWCVDHDHKTNRIRSILCAPCNSLIGLAGESTVVLEQAIIYIEAHDASRDDV
jgi:hypothetical protein